MVKMPEAGKKLSELRVCDLKEELERRKLDTIGAKASLVERLEKALKENGEDCNNFVFKKKITPMKKVLPKKDESIPQIKEEPVSEDEQTAEGEEQGYGDGKRDEVLVDEVGEVDEFIEIEDDEEEEEEYDENAANTELNNHDNEESLNLTIGEDEQNFLNEEENGEEKDNTNDGEEEEEHQGEENNEVGEEEEVQENEADGKKSKKVDTKKISSTDDTEEKKASPNAKSNESSTAVKGKKKDDKPANEAEKDDSNEKTTTKSNSQKDEKEKASAVAETTGTTAAASTATTAADSKPQTKSSSSGRNLWVSGLSSFTRASDLKTIFSKFGKVIGAKVVTNTRTPGTRCYGYVTMATSQDASLCIENLHRTELHGRIISVERTKNEIGGTANAVQANGSSLTAKRKEDTRNTRYRSDRNRMSSRGRKTSKELKGAGENSGDKESKDDATATNKDGVDNEKSVTSHKRIRPPSKLRDRRRPERPPISAEEREQRDREIQRRQRERERERERRQRELLKIREDRERERLRARERELREEERRRREIRERQREEEARLQEERRKLAQERERLEREKQELLRLERERQKLEREKIELERLELKRQQMKIMQTSRIDDSSTKRAVKRSADDRYADVSDRKRSSGNEARFDAPPPPRFDATLASSYDKKRDDYGGGASSKRDDYSSKRGDYVSSKRDEYTSSKRANVEYSSAASKRGKRDEYKREVEIRHIVPSSSSSNYHSSREMNAIHKSSRYAEPESVIRSSVTYRRGGVSGSGATSDDRNDPRTISGSKRYDGSGAAYERSSGSASASWSAAAHVGHSSHGVPPIKSFISNGVSSSIHSAVSGWPSKSAEEQAWRQMGSDRYDRTYNERSGPYMESSRPSGAAIYASSSGRAERYGGPVSRYETGKY